MFDNRNGHDQLEYLMDAEFCALLPRLAHLLVHTGPSPFQPVQRVGLQRGHDGSQGREVLAYSTLLLGHGEHGDSGNLAYNGGSLM